MYFREGEFVVVQVTNGDVVLLEIQPKVYEVFQLLGFSQFFNIKNTAEEAMDALLANKAKLEQLAKEKKEKQKNRSMIQP